MSIARSEELARLRAGSNKRNLMSVSRGSKRVIRPQTYEGTGSIPRLLKGMFPGQPKSVMEKLLDRVLDYSYKNTSGEFPPVPVVQFLAKNLVA